MHFFLITVLWRLSNFSLLLVKTVVRGLPGKHHSACQRWGWTTSTALRGSHLVLARQNISISWSWKLSQGRVCDLIQANDTSSGPLDLMKGIRTPRRSWTNHLSLTVTSEITSQPQNSLAWSPGQAGSCSFYPLLSSGVTTLPLVVLCHMPQHIGSPSWLPVMRIHFIIITQWENTRAVHNTHAWNCKTLETVAAVAIAKPVALHLAWGFLSATADSYVRVWLLMNWETSVIAPMTVLCSVWGPATFD